MSKLAVMKCSKGLSIDVQGITDDAAILVSQYNKTEQEALIEAATSRLDDLQAQRKEVMGYVENLYNEKQPKQKLKDSPLVSLFKSLGKNKQTKPENLQGHEKAELIANIQNHWLDILADHGFEQDKENGLKGRLSQTILMNGC